jgi:hypothetical protein
MKTWGQLSSEVAHGVYAIPFDIAFNPHNRFFGLPQNIDVDYMDSSWPLLAYLGNPNYPHVTTLQLYTAEVDEKDEPEFNPLMATMSNYLVLDDSMARSLVQNLREQAALLIVIDASSASDQYFKKLDPASLKAVGFDRQWCAPGTLYYQQTVQLLPDSQGILTIVQISNNLSAASKSLFLEINRFTSQSLMNPNFNPSDDSLARVDLDQQGMEEFAALLESFLIRVTERSPR